MCTRTRTHTLIHQSFQFECARGRSQGAAPLILVEEAQQSARRRVLDTDDDCVAPSLVGITKKAI